MPKFFLIAALAATVATAAELPALNPHPRLFVDGGTFASLKKRAATEKMLGLAAERMKSLADSYLDAAMPKHGITDGRRMLSTSHYVEKRVGALATAYRLYGDERYLRKAEQLMVAAAEMPDWNPSHFLDVAVMAYGVSMGYDWLYSDLRPDARRRIRDGLERNAVDAGIARRTLGSGKGNWAQVCPGGVICATVAIAEDIPEKCEKLVRQVVSGMPVVLKMYEPNGAYPEGPAYWGFGTEYTILMIAALESAYGTDFGLSSLPAFRATRRYPDLMCGPTRQRFNYADGNAGRGPSWAVWWFAKRLGDRGLVEAYERESFVRNLKYVDSPMFLLYAFDKTDDAVADLPLAWRSQGAVDIVVQRSSWDADARFAALKGGKATSAHGHMDGGSFVYDAKGVRWAHDLGADNYATIEHHIGMELWNYAEGSGRYRVFRLSAAAHNTLMLDGLPHCATGEVRVVSFTEGKDSRAALDMTALFTNATSVVRTGEMLNDGYRLVDRVKGLRDGAPIKWQMMTKAKPSVRDGRLILESSGKTLTVSRTVPAGTSDWTVDEAPHGEPWEADNKDYRRLSFVVPSSAAGTEFSVEFK